MPTSSPDSPGTRALSKLAVAALLAGLVAACGGGQPARTTFDLTAPADIGRVPGGRTQIVVNEPTTVQALDSDRILVRESSGAIAYLPDAQWADRVPRLVQVRLIQSFENASRLGSVGRPGERVVADYVLNLDIRSFNIETATSEAVVEITARLIGDRTGRVVAARAFSARRPGGLDGAAAARALDAALSDVLREVVRWGGRAA